jgi:hypothetical protein
MSNDSVRNPIIPTAPNLRDIGGYATRDGGHVRSWLLYRSEQLSQIADTDMAAFNVRFQLGAKTCKFGDSR